MTRALKQQRPRPALLLILEGFGIAPSGENNMITAASLPYFQHLITHYPIAALKTIDPSIAVSEASSRKGHTVIGTGRSYPEASAIAADILKHDSLLSFEGFRNFKKAIGKHNLHIQIFLSHAESEYSPEVVRRLLQWIQEEGDPNVYIHAVLDGRSSSPTSGQGLVEELQKIISNFPKACLVSLIGQLYAYDNKHNEARLKKAVGLWTAGKGSSAESAEVALSASYEKKIYDEEFAATLLPGFAACSSDDTFLFINFCSECARSAIEALVKKNIHPWLLINCPSLESIPFLIKREKTIHTLGSLIAEAGLKQLRISDSLGFAAVSSFFDAGEVIEKHTLKKLIPTPAGEALETAVEVTQSLSKEIIKDISEGTHDVIIANFSQLDMIAHRGTNQEIIEFLEKMDARLRLIIEPVIEAGGVVLLTSSHGFAEAAYDPASGEKKHDHSSNNIPLCLIGKEFEGYNLGWPEAIGGDLSVLQPIGTLADIAPTFLNCLLLNIPPEMTGHNLINQ